MTTKTAMEMLERLSREIPQDPIIISRHDFKKELDAAISQLRKEQAAIIPRSEVDKLLDEEDMPDAVRWLLEKYPQEPK